MPITVATWNINSIRARLPEACAWLREAQPDIVLLQETKAEDHNFPAMEIEDLGYNLALHGQKTYNGVAILSKHRIEDVTRGLPTLPENTDARYIEGLISLKGIRDWGLGIGKDILTSNPQPLIPTLRVASIYVPNGGEVGSEKFGQKLRFLEALRLHAETLLLQDEMLALGGDYNVAPADMDVYAPAALRGTTCFHPEEQKRLRALEYLGLTDAFRARYPDRQQFSWWDYRSSGWEHNKGMRIDHLLLSPQAADALEDAGIDDTPRGKPKASDHAPVWCRLGVGC